MIMGTTKIGVPAKLLAGLTYVAAFFSGYTAFLLMGGYVLLREQNDWLRFQTVKAGVLLVCFSLAGAVVSLIPNLFSWIGDWVNLFGGSFRVAFIFDLQSVLNSTLNLLEKLLFLVLGILAFRGKDLPIAPLDKLVNGLLDKIAPSKEGE